MKVWKQSTYRDNKQSQYFIKQHSESSALHMHSNDNRQLLLYTLSLNDWCTSVITSDFYTGPVVLRGNRVFSLFCRLLRNSGEVRYCSSLWSKQIYQRFLSAQFIKNFCITSSFGFLFICKALNSWTIQAILYFNQLMYELKNVKHF